MCLQRLIIMAMILLLFAQQSFAQDNSVTVRSLIHQDVQSDVRPIAANSVASRFYLDRNQFVVAEINNKSSSKLLTVGNEAEITQFKSKQNQKSIVLGTGYNYPLNPSSNLSASVLLGYQTNRSDVQNTSSADFNLPDIDSLSLESELRQKDEIGLGYRVAYDTDFENSFNLKLKYEYLEIDDGRQRNEEGVDLEVGYKFSKKLSAKLGIQDQNNGSYVSVSYHF